MVPLLRLAHFQQNSYKSVNDKMASKEVQTLKYFLYSIFVYIIFTKEGNKNV